MATMSYLRKLPEPLKDDGSETIRQLRVAMPDAFTSHHNTYKEHELHLNTNDQDRVKTAWQYIYSHGCTGKQSHLRSEASAIQDILRIQMEFVRSQLEAFGEQAKELAEAYIKAA